ncbi:MAG: hypothetical protein ABR502_06875, partial [Chitinophagaceae bacterium]
MTSNVQHIVQVLSEKNLSEADKNAIVSAIKSLDKATALTEFKLGRIEKEKITLTILLEETIEELEQKRKAIEAQNRELQIEAALERVRASAMAMHNTDDLSSASSVVFAELRKLSIYPMRAGVGILNRENRKALWYAASTSAE